MPRYIGKVIGHCDHSIVQTSREVTCNRVYHLTLILVQNSLFVFPQTLFSCRGEGKHKERNLY